MTSAHLKPQGTGHRAFRDRGATAHSVASSCRTRASERVERLARLPQPGRPTNLRSVVSGPAAHARPRPVVLFAREWRACATNIKSVATGQAREWPQSHSV